MDHFRRSICQDLPDQDLVLFDGPQDKEVSLKTTGDLLLDIQIYQIQGTHRHWNSQDLLVGVLNFLGV